MSCEYCENEKIILVKEVPYSIGFTNEINGYNNHGLFIDRGHIRLADLEDCDCLDHGEKFKINYCFNCGDKLDKEG